MELDIIAPETIVSVSENIQQLLTQADLPEDIEDCDSECLPSGIRSCRHAGEIRPCRLAKQRHRRRQRDVICRTISFRPECT